ncbi:MAG: NAD(P)/FAD-dependent oxidoreductase [Bdellovibrionales bacterium]|nr:NAD(P)/FAD-dependent oxidoreductase [Bdellovibrionales bacterium]
MKIAVIGGGAAGYFAAITAAQADPTAKVCIFEASPKPLAKVKISGGGRCNVTHGCFDTKNFVRNYPRGANELRGAFDQFQAADTVRWFESRGVALKREADGRMFPVTDSSQTIIDCLEKTALQLGITLETKCRIVSVDNNGGSFSLSTSGTQVEHSIDRVVLAPGGGKIGHKIAQVLGHTIVPAVPSLFTFNIDDYRIRDLSGLSVHDSCLKLSCGSSEFNAEGALLITHWGLSGPAVLKLSAWAARELFENNYHAQLTVNWVGRTTQLVGEELRELRSNNPKKKPRSTSLEGVPKRLWLKLLEVVQIPEERSWAEVGNKTLEHLQNELTAGSFEISGKGIFKEEFVTCGGVELSEVDFTTMESRLVPGLFLAGEILNIDGLTGGFNFQSAWTTGYLAGKGATR